MSNILSRTHVKIGNRSQYDWAIKRVEEALPLVNDNTPLDDPNPIKLELLSNLVSDYSEEHFAFGTLWTFTTDTEQARQR